MAPRLRLGEKALSPVRPNAGITAAYRRKIFALIDEMQRSTAYWLKAAYRSDPPIMAQDATPAAELNAAVERMARRWQQRFDDAAPDLAAFFMRRVSRQSDLVLQRILRDAGYSVRRFKITAALRDVMRASIEENVSLIKSIPSQYHTEVQGLVMRSVQRGRDVGYLAKELEKRFEITRRRAKLIAIDQNNKITSAILAARQTAIGIEEGIWQHSMAGKEPRKTHLANDGKRFSIAEGWFDPDPKVRRRIWPGEEINCRCTWRPVVKGFS